MASRRHVITFLHVSDLHFGHQPSAPPHPPGARLPTLYNFAEVFHGYVGHHHAALEDLEEFHHELASNEPTRLIVTGDLTRNGHPAQFDMAASYFNGGLPVPGGLLGLNDARWQDLCISGNHDGWPGKDLPVGWPACPQHWHFHAQPSLFHLKLPNHLLCFLRVDSDADVHPLTARRVMAQGCFVTQLNALETKLGPPMEEETRVMLIHHSPSHRHQGWLSLTEITPRSSAALEAFVAKHRVQILLTGHIHTPAINRRVIYTGGVTTEYMEARCGTTTQMDMLVQPWNKTVRLPTVRNCLMVHRLYENPLTWETSLHHRTRTGFETTPDHVHEFQL